MLAMIGGAANLLGGLFDTNSSAKLQGDMMNMMEYNPGGYMGPGGSGSFVDGNFMGTESAGAAARRGMMNNMFAGGMGGGFFSDPGFQQAFGQASGGMGADFANAQGLQNIMMGNTAFGNFGQQTRDLMSSGMSNLQKAGDTSGLINQNLAASRALAQPFEQQMRNNFFDTEFGKTLGATSGAGQRGQDFATSQMLADQKRIQDAMGLGQRQSEFLGNLGMNQFGQAMGAEGQGFNQMLSALQQNQGAGQQRLQNAMGMFTMGNDLTNQGFNRAFQSEQMLMGRDNYMMNLMNALAGNESNRISAQAGGFSGLASMNQQKSGGFMDMLGGVGDIVGGIFGG